MGCVMCGCGGYKCEECGLREGNVRCPICGAWLLDGGCRDMLRCVVALRKRSMAEFTKYRSKLRLAAAYRKWNTAAKREAVRMHNL